MLTRAQVLRRTMKAALRGRGCTCGAWTTHKTHTARCPVGVAFTKALETWDWLEMVRTFEEALESGSALAETNHGCGG